MDPVSFTAPAFAEAASEEAEHDNSKPGEWHPVTFSLENAQDEEVVSTIPKGEAYIPKGTKLEVSLREELSSKKSARRRSCSLEAGWVTTRKWK